MAQHANYVRASHQLENDVLLHERLSCPKLHQQSSNNNQQLRVLIQPTLFYELLVVSLLGTKSTEVPAIEQVGEPLESTEYARGDVL